MEPTKVSFKIGQIEFSAEGEKEWVAAQLDKVIEKASGLLALAPVDRVDATNRDPSTHHKPMDSDPGIASKPLAALLKEKDATTNQNKKFLVTAVWLESKGQKRLATTDVTKALSNASQSKLGNASECLNQNVKKGLCEKEGTQFYVTQEGKDSL